MKKQLMVSGVLLVGLSGCGDSVERLSCNISLLGLMEIEQTYDIDHQTNTIMYGTGELYIFRKNGDSIVWTTEGGSVTLGPKDANGNREGVYGQAFCTPR